MKQNRNKKFRYNYRLQIYGSELGLDNTSTLNSNLTTSLFIINEISQSRVEAKFDLNYATSGFI